MHVLLDHLSAVIVGTMLLTALLVFQMRERLNSVDEAMRYELQAEGEAVMSTLGQDLNNLVTEAEAGTLGLSVLRCRLERHPDGVVKALECPGQIETDAINSEPGTVRYWTQPDGSSYAVGDSVRAAYTLHRDIDTDSGVQRQVVAQAVVGFDVAFFGAAGAQVTDGDAPADLHALRFRIDLASDGTDALASDQAAERSINVAQFGHTVRPPNLTYLERSASGGFVTDSSPDPSETTSTQWFSGGDSGSDDDDDDD
ncbi:MAG: hypothetical protein AAF624_11610 [Bacteroidota bacterium]